MCAFLGQRSRSQGEGRPRRRGEAERRGGREQGASASLEVISKATAGLARAPEWVRENEIPRRRGRSAAEWCAGQVRCEREPGRCARVVCACEHRRVRAHVGARGKGERERMPVSGPRQRAGTAAASRTFSDKQKATMEGGNTRGVDGSDTCKNDQLGSMAGSQATAGLRGGASRQRHPNITRAHKALSNHGSKVGTQHRGRGAHLGCGSSDETVGKACGGTEQPGASGCRTGAALSSIGPTHPRSASDLRGGRRPWHVQHISLLPLLFFFCLPHSQRNGGLGEMSASRYPRRGQRHGALGGGPVFLPVLSSSLLVIAGRACGGLGKIPPRWRCRTGRATVGGFL
jgi:hypothetical protein